MDVNMNSTNFNNVNNQTFDSSSQLDNLKATYVGYAEKIDKTDFSNSLTRYQIQYNMLKDIKKIATDENNEAELKFVDEQYRMICEKMKQFGVKPKEL